MTPRSSIVRFGEFRAGSQQIPGPQGTRKQNATLKWLLAEAELEKAALNELAEGNF